MKTNIENIYNLTKQDLLLGGQVMADAFAHDPLWEKFFDGDADKPAKLSACHEVPLRLSHCYGHVIAPSKELEGIAAWLPGDKAAMTFWRMVMSGALGAAFRMGAEAGKKMEQVFAPLEQDRADQMAGRDFVYLYLLGVRQKAQRKGFGKQLLQAVIAHSEANGTPIYLDTETEQNAQMYEHFGFKTLKQITLPIINQPMWEMVREV